MMVGPTERNFDLNHKEIKLNLLNSVESAVLMLILAYLTLLERVSLSNLVIAMVTGVLDH